MGRFLVYGFVLLILLFVCFNLIFFKYWADYHVTQTFEMMNLQGAQIKSQTIALMKQNDFAMTSSDLKAAALTISDLYSLQEKLVDTSTLQSKSGFTKFVSSPFVSQDGKTTARLNGF